MHRRAIGRVGLACLLASAWPGIGWAAPRPQETPFWSDRVRDGTLPPVAKRLPSTPSVVNAFAGSDGPGRSGGTIHTLVGSERDTRLMSLYGYARLIAFDTDYALKADILDSYAVEEGRIFTLKLRAGHRWSDGHPFTAEDFRYWWEDVANNTSLNPNGPPGEMLVNGKPPVFEIVDPQTVRFTWQAPNPYFLEAQARALPLYIYRPAHYLRQFHSKYAEPKALEAAIAKGRSRDWVRLHHRLDQMYVSDNPDLPSLAPWVTKTPLPSTRLVFERNPYYHRIDANGVQLPYLDQVVLDVASAGLIPMKAGTGETDLQARYLKFDDYTYLKKGSKQFPFEVYLWETGNGSEVALYPNLNQVDPELRKLFRDARFRRALSLAIDREEINETVFLGMAHPGNNTVRRESVLYNPDYAKRWTSFDLKQANRLLDELGLTKRDNEGIRLLPDGRPLLLIIERTGDTREQVDTLTLLQSTWRKAGIGTALRSFDRQLLRDRVMSGQTMISVWPGIENAQPTPSMSPRELAPGTQGDLQWPKWGMFIETKGKSGEACDMPEVQHLIDLVGRWEKTVDSKEQEAIWREMLAAHADQQFTIGIVSGSRQPVVVGRRLRNVPKTGVHSWHPGSFFGIYRPDTFWLAPG